MNYCNKKINSKPPLITNESSVVLRKTNASQELTNGSRFSVYDNNYDEINSSFVDHIYVNSSKNADLSSSSSSSSTINNQVLNENFSEILYSIPSKRVILEDSQFNYGDLTNGDCKKEWEMVCFLFILMF